MTESTGRLDQEIGRSIFGQDAAGYDSARVGYPSGLFERLFERTDVPQHVSIFEVGAGTGLATRDLLARSPATLVAIEPDPRLASYLIAKLAQTSARLRVRVAPFEENGLEDSCFDLGAAAACFHWLDAERSLREVRRLLRPGGCWSMWWNVYRATGIGDPFAEDVADLIRTIPLPPSEGAAGHTSLDEPYQRELLRVAGFRDIEYQLFRRERMLGAREMCGLYASYSFVRRLGESERQRLLSAIAELVEQRYAGRAPNFVLTPLYLATSPGAAAG